VLVFVAGFNAVEEEKIEDIKNLEFDKERKERIQREEGVEESETSYRPEDGMTPFRYYLNAFLMTVFWTNASFSFFLL